MLEAQLTLFRDYENFVRSRVKSMATPIEDRLHAAVGIAGEAGELLDAIKKTWVYNKPLDEGNVIEELGDLMFYIQAMALVQGVSLAYVMAENTQKLLTRYPTGYTDAAAQARVDKV